MNSEMILDVIDTHTEGEPTRIMFWNRNMKKFDSVYKLREYFKENYDYIRETMLLEPRGHNNQFGAIIFPAISEDADYSLIFLTTNGYLDMCGHATIGVSTALIELGMLDLKGNERKIVYDTVAGKVSATVNIENGRAKSVSIIDVSSYYCGSGNIDFKGKKIKIDIAYGGNFYAIVRSDDINLEVKKENIDKLIEYGNIIRGEAYSKLKNLLSINNGNSYPLAMIVDEKNNNEIVIFSKNSFDRSPCGTGTAARSALLFHEKKLKINEYFINKSVIGSEFKCRIISLSEDKGKVFAYPEITGSAWITQISKIIIDPEDPFKHGFNI